MKHNNNYSKAILLIAPFVFSSCASCLNVFGSKVISDEEISKHGSDAFLYMKSKYKVTNNAKFAAKVNCVFKQLTKHVDKAPKGTSWEIFVAKGKELNISSLPGGKLLVYDEMGKIFTSPNELAIFIAGSISQVVTLQARERLIRAVFDEGGDSSKYPYDGYSGSAYIESDQAGIELMIQSGFNPTNAEISMRKFLSNRSSWKELAKKRIEATKSNMPKYMQQYHFIKNKSNSHPCN